MSSLATTSSATGSAAPAAKIGLWILLGVIAVLFAQFIHAYAIRLGGSDWRTLPELPLLRLNTLALLGGSVALHWAGRCAARQRPDRCCNALLLAGALAAAFIAGQLEAWRQLLALHYAIAGNPANSFFYLITGLHGLHVLGGLAAWLMVTAKAWRGRDVRAGIALCATYWDFLFAVWIALYGLLFLGTPTLIQALCTAG
jgi:cytochrome c oxidase subunit 3